MTDVQRQIEDGCAKIWRWQAEAKALREITRMVQEYDVKNPIVIKGPAEKTIFTRLRPFVSIILTFFVTLIAG